MKTSNKILLALFLLPFIVVTLVAFTFYSTYKSGKFITQEEYVKEKEFSAKTPSFNSVRLSSYHGDVSIKQSDSFAIVLFDWDKDKIIHEVKDGVLTFHSKNQGDYPPVTILCPSLSSITTDTASVSIAGVLKNTAITAGAESNVYINGNAENLQLDIKREGNVNLGNGTIQKLRFTVNNGGSLNANEATILEFSNELSIEDSAAINFSGKTLRAFLQQKENKQ